MSETPAVPPLAETLAKPEALMRVPMGLVSPLWGLFAGAAIGGSAWWWMTRWARPQNLEAMFGSAADAAPALVEPAESVAEPVLDAEPAVEAVEAVEAVIEPPVLDAPVGGEAAPVAPALAAAEPEPAKPRAKKAVAKPE